MLTYCATPEGIVTLGHVVRVNGLEATPSLNHNFLPLGITEQHESAQQGLGVGGRGYGWVVVGKFVAAFLLVRLRAGFIIVERHV